MKYLILVLLILSGCNSEYKYELPKESTISGQVTTEEDVIVQDGIITVDGVSTNIQNGNYELIYPYDTQTEKFITVDSKGFELFSQYSDITRINLKKQSNPKTLEVDEFVFKGFASQINITRPKIDLVIAIDSSGSMSKTFDNITRYKAAIRFSQTIIDRLDINKKRRVCVIRFYSDYEIISQMGNDKEASQEALNILSQTGPLQIDSIGAGTDFQKVLNASLEQFGNTKSNDRVRVVLFVTDGTPTLPYASGATQERQDMISALESAKTLANNNVQIYSIGIRNDNSFIKLSTLPALAAITKGRFYHINSLQTLERLENMINFVGISRLLVNDIETAFSMIGEFNIDHSLIGEVVIKAISDRSDEAFKKLILRYEQSQ